MKEKTKEERSEEINKVVKLLFSNNYSMEIEGMVTFLKICKEFIDNGTAWEGELIMEGTKHKLVGHLTNKKNKKCDLMLKYDKNL